MSRARTKRTGSEGSPLQILMIIGPLLIVFLVAPRYLPKLAELGGLNKPQAVRFSKVWFSVRNTSPADWEGGEAILNERWKLRLGPVRREQVLEVLYSKFGTNMTLEGVEQVTIKPDGGEAMTHRPTRDELERFGIRRPR